MVDNFFQVLYSQLQIEPLVIVSLVMALPTYRCKILNEIQPFVSHTSHALRLDVVDIRSPISATGFAGYIILLPVLKEPHVYLSVILH